MPVPNLYFTAPLDFDYNVLEEYKARFNLTHGVMADVWVCNPSAHFTIDDDILDGMPRLKLLATPSTGNNHIDLKACQERGIKVISLLDDRKALEEISASAEFTFKLILDMLRKPPAHELQDKTVGIVGVGRIGSKVGRWSMAFGAHVIFFDTWTDSTLEYVFEQSDVVVISCTLNDETRGMITGDLLRKLKHGAALVNTARGDIINEGELIDVLTERRDLRVALDVIQGEATGTDNPGPLLINGVTLSNHIAGETYESRTKAAKIILRLIEREMTTWETYSGGA